MATQITEDGTSCGACEDVLFARAKTVDGIMPAAEELSAETSRFRAGEAAE